MADHHRRSRERCWKRVNLFWWVVSIGILVGLFWLAKAAEPDLRSSPDGSNFDCKYHDVELPTEGKAPGSERVRWRRGRGELIDGRVLVMPGPFARSGPYDSPLPIIGRSPKPPKKTSVYLAGEGSTYVAVAVARQSPADERLAELLG
jgi:hypothetical protein